MVVVEEKRDSVGELTTSKPERGFIIGPAGPRPALLTITRDAPCLFTPHAHFCSGNRCSRLRLSDREPEIVEWSADAGDQLTADSASDEYVNMVRC